MNTLNKPNFHYTVANMVADPDSQQVHVGPQPGPRPGHRLLHNGNWVSIKGVSHLQKMLLLVFAPDSKAWKFVDRWEWEKCL